MSKQTVRGVEVQSLPEDVIAEYLPGFAPASA